MSWLTLRRRISFAPTCVVLIFSLLPATGEVLQQGEIVAVKELPAVPFLLRRESKADPAELVNLRQPSLLPAVSAASRRGGRPLRQPRPDEADPGSRALGLPDEQLPAAMQVLFASEAGGEEQRLATTGGQEATGVTSWVLFASMEHSDGGPVEIVHGPDGRKDDGVVRSWVLRKPEEQTGSLLDGFKPANSSLKDLHSEYDKLSGCLSADGSRRTYRIAAGYACPDRYVRVATETSCVAAARCLIRPRCYPTCEPDGMLDWTVRNVMINHREKEPKGCFLYGNPEEGVPYGDLHFNNAGTETGGYPRSVFCRLLESNAPPGSSNSSTLAHLSRHGNGSHAGTVAARLNHSVASGVNSSAAGSASHQPAVLREHVASVVPSRAAGSAEETSAEDAIE
eukprot:TRINITY_DN33777_c0_g1_i1.p1 TRINITY_DN33777_c0_g1~~TRINITY_DN33777_c0_g1_i1.p1  ORF type:complete len:397 (+),score=52.30 TRINITY_DN33777_c0_g1_i1:142-1332(+)